MTSTPLAFIFTSTTIVQQYSHSFTITSSTLTEARFDIDVRFQADSPKNVS
ncbi:hypothetical protein GcC1_130021 [Golovinomyces cichoracearum]|uniref:Uncharacterized protein n=1 Tax=Golovinomyces cichoracearum TaxID=62708 RepID=A0A420I4S1_9PEZI|nr:hypothetical protein GcC1_130021 [Golovinomyces cichoracearum]